MRYHSSVLNRLLAIKSNTLLPRFHISFHLDRSAEQSRSAMDPSHLGDCIEHNIGTRAAWSTTSFARPSVCSGSRTPPFHPTASWLDEESFVLECREFERSAVDFLTH